MIIKKSQNEIQVRKKSQRRPSFDGDMKQAEVFYTEDKRVKCTGIFGK